MDGAHLPRPCFSGTDLRPSGWARGRSRIGAPLLAVLSLSVIVSPAASGQESSSPDSAKSAVARAVYDDLVRAAGDGRSAPELRLLAADARGRGDRAVAWYDASRREIVLEERAYDVMATFGSDSLDALAVLLAHELAHYYRGHSWPGDFARAYGDLEAARTVGRRGASLEEAIRVETEADYFGGLYGYMAGYATLGLTAPVLDSIYRGYGFPERIPGYPSLSDRRRIAEDSEERLRELIPIFEAGVRLLLVDRHRAAARAFEHVARTFPSREILNDAGVAWVLEALPLLPPDGGVRPFVHPLGVDPTTRLRGGRARGAGDRTEARRMLEEARDLFQQALGRDPEYAQALVNLAIAQDLLGESEIGAALAGRAARMATGAEDRAVRLSALVVRGVALARSGDVEAARRALDAAAAEEAPLAEVNLRILAGEDPLRTPVWEEEEDEEEGTRAAPERIAGRTPGADRVDGTTEERTLVVPGRGEGSFLYLTVRRGDAWEELVADLEDEVISFLSTPSGYEGATARGVRIGDSRTAVLAAYGPSAEVRPARSGTFLLYPAAGLVFQLDGEDRVSGWFLVSVVTR